MRIQERLQNRILITLGATEARTALQFGVILVVCACAMQAQQPAVPRVTYFSGVVKDTAGNPQTGMVGITFSLYQEQQGGTALWSEIQNVTLDNLGRYTVLLGSTQPEGLPLEVFASGKARWLGVTPQVAVVAEQPRVLLVGVPYALKAADADTLGGLPASAFLQSAASTQATGALTAASTTSAGTFPNAACTAVTSNGTAKAGQIARVTIWEAINPPPRDSRIHLQPSYLEDTAV